MTAQTSSVLPFVPPRDEYLSVLCDIARSLSRIADAVAPTPPDLVGTDYVAERTARTMTRVTQWVTSGVLPADCVHSGGDGSPYKFYRDRIDRWLESR